MIIDVARLPEASGMPVPPTRKAGHVFLRLLKLDVGWQPLLAEALCTNKRLSPHQLIMLKTINHRNMVKKEVNVVDKDFSISLRIAGARNDFIAIILLIFFLTAILIVGNLTLHSHNSDPFNGSISLLTAMRWILLYVAIAAAIGLIIIMILILYKSLKRTETKNIEHTNT